ncbi:MAG: fliQ [Firmicutes bacterium]|nr:fliQ [Bacillota bacterium]
MNQGMALDLIGSAFVNMIKVSAPVMVVAMVVGLIISILQATTQVQEQTLSFVPKMLAVIVSLILFGTFMMNTMLDFFRYVLEIIPKL